MNPYAPKEAWLAAVTGTPRPERHDADIEPGDSGEQRVERNGRTYLVTVEVLDA